jgi:plastocyanin
MRKRWLAPALTVVMGACGGSSSTQPSTPPSTTPAPPPGGPTITITAAGVSPKQLEVTVGSRVTFTNNDSVPHEMYSDPHPSHGDCPPIDEVSVVTPGQSRQTGVFSSARTCGYHDHGQSTNTSLQGTIVIR